MASVEQWLQTLLIFFISAYRYALSALFGACCRFEPTCSSYALNAIREFGCVKGSFLTIQRLLKCHPWHAGGFDPLPNPKIKSTPNRR